MRQLIRIDPTEHMNRWYAVTVQATLFEPAAVVCLWGSRETTYQQMQVIPAASLEAAQALADKIVAAKLRRGYQLIFSAEPPADHPSASSA